MAVKHGMKSGVDLDVSEGFGYWKIEMNNFQRMSLFRTEPKYFSKYRSLKQSIAAIDGEAAKTKQQPKLISEACGWQQQTKK